MATLPQPSRPAETRLTDIFVIINPQCPLIINNMYGRGLCFYEFSFDSIYMSTIWSTTGFSCMIAGVALMSRKDSDFTAKWNEGFSKILSNGRYSALCKEEQEKHGKYKFLHSTKSSSLFCGTLLDSFGAIIAFAHSIF